MNRVRTRRVSNVKVRRVRISLKHIHGHQIEQLEATKLLHEAVCQVLQNQHDLNHSLRTLIMASQTQLAADLQAVSAQLTKIGTETTALLEKVAELETAVANGGQTTPEVDAALAAVKTQAQVVDDLVEDAP